MQDIDPTRISTITESVRFKPGTYYLPDGLRVAGDNIVIEGNHATLIGQKRSGRGITVTGQQHVTIRNLRIRDYQHGIFAQDCSELTVEGCHITSTAEVAPATIFLDIWRDSSDPYGGGILLNNVQRSTVKECDLQHQMVGLLTYHCRGLTVAGNLANYNSGFGFHLYDTSQSRFANNQADFCCRYQPRGEGAGHMGADAAGFLIVAGSSDNQFVDNTARMGGDGFFLAGLNPQYELRPCNNNLFEGNDVSHSPNIGFEATFSAGNVFRGNKAHFCNYGLWLGFSRANRVEENDIVANRGAGIAVENGIHCQIQANTIRANGHGVLLWSKHVPRFDDVVPDNHTSHHWLIGDNTITRNVKGIRIAADQDHGVRPHTPAGPRPYQHTIRRNTIQQNRLAIELMHVEDTTLEDNTLGGNRDDIVRHD